MKKPARSSFQYLSISYECALAIGNSLNLSEMLREVIHTMVHKTNAHRGIIWVRNGEQKLQPVASAGISIEDARAQGETVGLQDVLNQILKRQQFVLGTKDGTDFLQYCPVLTGKEESVLIVPVTNVAVLYLVYASQEVADKLLANLLTSLSKKLAVAIEACTAHKNIADEVRVRVEAEKGLEKKTEQLIFNEKELQRLYGESNQARKSLLSILEDVTLKEEALSEANRIINRSPAVAFLWENEEGWPVEFVSENVKELLGYSAQEFMERKISFSQVIHSDDFERIERELADHSEKEGLQTFEREPYRVITKNGAIKWVDDMTYIRRDSRGIITHYEGIVYDITERLRLEEQLRQTSKMEAIGQLAGGVAHDFNNLLTVINGYCEFISDELDEGDPMRQDVEEIRQAGQRAVGLTRQLLIFSRREELEMRVLSLNDVLQGVTKMLRRLIGEDIRLEIKLASDAGNIRSDPGQIEQVVMNLVVNARDAMPKGGTLTIETANVALDPADILLPMGAEPGAYVALSIKDTGHGMTPEIIERLFEPFFTTKEAGHGTGLGLATVYGIVEQSSGAINVRSQPRKGSAFTIYFPQVDEKITTESSQGQTPLPRGTETILLVEDETSIRELVARALQSWGYTVIEAANGAEALALSEASQEAIDLVLADVVMPEMDGPDLVERLRHICPDIKVLYMSGYAGRVLAGRGDLRAPLIRKPLNLDSLAHRVRQVMDE